MMGLRSNRGRARVRRPAMLLVPGAAPAAGTDAVTAWLQAHPLAASAVGLVLLAGAAWLALVAVRRWLLRILGHLAQKSAAWWDEVLLDREVFHRAAWVVPVLVVYQGIGFVPYLPAELAGLVRRVALAALALVAIRAFSALLAAINEIYGRYPISKERPIKGMLQVISVVAHIGGGILAIAALLDRDPLLFLSGLGAMTAVAMLVFRDSILSLVAGVQITANGLIRVGDWIEMPQFGADGDVIDIALNSVRVQNWDKTITVIPTHQFLEHSFKNWRGMQESGGRRIKRAFHVDIGTIRFLTDDEIERFGRFVLLKDYIARKKQELEAYNRQHAPDPSLTANARRLTNVGTLRAYIIEYLRQHPKLRKDMTLMVRQLQPGPEGLPIEIYAFTADTAWKSYETIQADIFDHVLAIVPEFGLKVYQKPSGHDVAAVGARAAARPRQRV
ncbi:MAG TPA: mechanosensitive ion channel domain-containing protein [Longimicrobiales bacterium]